MVQEFVKQAILPRVQLLAYFEKTAGIVTTAFRDVPGENGAAKQQVFPVSCDVTEECWQSGAYKDLAPDDSKKSIGYFELGGQRMSFNNPRRGRHGIVSIVRFVAWFNLNRLGVSGCDLPTEIMVDLWKAFNVDGLINSPYPGVSGSIKPVQVLAPDVRTIFGRYTYSDKSALFLAPYTFLAMDLEIALSFDEKCVPAFEPGAVINC